MFRNSISIATTRTGRKSIALFLLGVMVWLGATLFTHTISEHHLLNHIGSYGSNVASGTDECILLIFSSTPFEKPIFSGPGIQPKVGDIIHWGTKVYALFSSPSSLTTLRAPPLS